MTTASIPVGLRVHLSHATIQAIADECGADILHIKGPAVDSALRPLRAHDDSPGGFGSDSVVPRQSSDADVLVRPSHLDDYMSALVDLGWSVVTRFETGSAFEHAASLWHTQLGWVDVHRTFPGIEADAEAAFATLWHDRLIALIAHWPCAVPSVTAQRLILLLHAAREGGPAHVDVGLAWNSATESERDAVTALAKSLSAEVGLSAATGHLDDFASDPTYDLWRHFLDRDPSRMSEWRARFKAARTARERLRLLLRASLVNTDRLTMELWRPPTRIEVLREYARRVGTLASEVGSAFSRRWRRPR